MNASNCLKGFPFVAFVDGMNVIDHRAVQIPLQEIISASICWHLTAGLGLM